LCLGRKQRPSPSAADRALLLQEYASGHIPVQMEGWELGLARHGDHRQQALRLGRDVGRRRIPAGSGRALARFPSLARFASRPLVLDLADEVSSHIRERMIEVALVGGGNEVRSSR
jgi:hypothetical protein